MPFAIALVASKNFFNTLFIHCGPELKNILRDEALDYVINKFHLLSSPNVRNIIFSSWNNNKGGGEIGRILDMKGRDKMEYIHDSAFIGQAHKKIYLFTMLVDGLGSGANFVWRMQPRSDLQNCFVMFDHVKIIKS